MITIGHIINTVAVAPASDLGQAQPITLETMRIAREFAAPDQGVSLYAVQDQSESPAALPGCFTSSRGWSVVLDVRTFRVKRKLPLISDILDTLYESSRADYLVYTNVDIALMPYFYRTVACLLQKGYDAFAINRRTIAEAGQLPLMFAALGESHKGYDCFVFQRDMYPRFRLGSICVGPHGSAGPCLPTLLPGAPGLQSFGIFTSRFTLGTHRHGGTAGFPTTRSITGRNI